MTHPQSKTTTTQQHTPGPWRMYDATPGRTNGRHTGLCFDIEADDGKYLVASTTDGAWQAKANARLIAAAPDMLEAGNAVVRNAITGEAPSGFALVRLEDFSALSAAIAMATGVQS